jgi:nitrate reductase cytochrome c-type subunit
MGSRNGYVAAKDKLQNGNQKKRQDSLARYTSNPKRCLECDAIIPYEKRFGGKFCSQSCSAKHSNRLRKSRKRSATCLQCGVSLVGLAGKKYCSKDCESSYKSAMAVANESVLLNQWLSGSLSGTTKSGAPRNFIRKWLMGRSSGKCESCGWSERNQTTGLIPLNMDHIDGDSLNNDVGNLRLLCPNCHSLTPTYGSLNNGKGRKDRRLRRYKQASL